MNGYGGDEIVVLRLAGRTDTARTVGVLTEQDTCGELGQPTPAALVAGALYVVNGRSSVAGPTTENFVTRCPCAEASSTRSVECRGRSAG